VLFLLNDVILSDIMSIVSHSSLWVTNALSYYNFYYYCYSKCHDARSRTYLWQML